MRRLFFISTIAFILKDILIVGFGLAGLAVAHYAEERGLSFNVINDNSQLSSRVAGGLLNPIAIKRMKPVWNLEEFLPHAKAYYKNLQEKYSTIIYDNKIIKTYIHDTYSENNWYEALDNVRMNAFISNSVFANNNTALNTEKIGEVFASQIDLPNLFENAQKYYKAKKYYIQGKFVHDDIVVHNTSVSYQNISYRHVIFCEGYGVLNNPYFYDLAIYGNKGDYLIIRASDLNTLNILKSKYFLIPIGNNLYKFGATYQRQPLDHKPSQEARNQMEEALEKMINVPFEIVDQICGIRPTTKDRKPILGTHRTFKNLHILNGFGSRGVITSPLLGKQLIGHVFNSEELSKDISINRIYARI